MSSSKSKNPTSPRPSCFSNILQRVICNGNVPRQQSLPNQVTKRTSKINPVPLNNSRSVIPSSATDVVENKTRVQTRAVAEAEAEVIHSTPGIVARLMGLDILPPSSQNDSLFRSRSLNSLYILPDFDPARASFHRRARTSASFHEQGHNMLFKIDENVEPNCRKRVEQEKVRKDSKRVKEKREDNAVILKKNEDRKGREKEGRSKKMYDEGYATTRKKNNVGCSSIRLSEKNAIMQKRNLVEKKVKRNVNVGSTVASKKKVEYLKEDPNVELQSDALSRSPVSVLDDHCHEFKPPSKEDRRQVNSSLRRKSSRKIKISEEMPQKDVPKSKKKEQSSHNLSFKDKPTKIDGAVTEYFAELMDQICMLAEEDIRDPKWNKRNELIKVQCVEEMCMNFGQEMLDALLDELIVELVVSGI